MTAQNAYWCSTTKLPCSCGALPYAVIICVPNAITVTGLGFIDATLTGVAIKCAPCGSSSLYNYTFSYDDAVLVDPENLITSAEISGVICTDCLTSWVDTLTNISPEADNALVLVEDGLFVPSTTLIIGDTDTVNLTLSALPVPQELTATVNISADTPQLLVSLPDGLYARDRVLATGTFIANGATAVVIATSAASTDMVVSYGLSVVGGTPAAKPYESAIVAGVSFSAKAAAGDTSTYNWAIFDTT